LIPKNSRRQPRGNRRLDLLGSNAGYNDSYVPIYDYQVQAPISEVIRQPDVRWQRIVLPALVFGLVVLERQESIVHI